MTYLEWLKTYDKSHITHPSRQDVWDAAWNYQQAKIDAAIEYSNTASSSLDLDIDKIKEILK